ncbi:MAG: dihydropteroate synthase [Candidatus Omnitrophica bacterium]|nr:dihydropteroate synthase [Candidatus Omnitrophota bacterium]
MTTTTLNTNFTQRKEFQFTCQKHKIDLGKKTRIMGILNLTDDSFSNDGIYKDPSKAEELGLKMVAAGADIIDIGGESTRPGALKVSLEEEIERVLPVIKRLAKSTDVPISIDTSNSETARAALEVGACIVNDISGLTFDKHMPSIVSQFKAGCIIMHIKGTPRTMQQNPLYTDLITEICASLKKCVSKAMGYGIDKKNIAVDPGIGFGKTTEHNLEIIKRLGEFAQLDLPILIGPSRKSFIGNVLDLPVEKRLIGTIASVVASVFNGAHIVRVHDVGEIAQAVKMADAILQDY